jgi:hypothetical protein
MRKRLMNRIFLVAFIGIFLLSFIGGAFAAEVGDIVTSSDGSRSYVNADGTLTDVRENVVGAVQSIAAWLGNDNFSGWDSFGILLTYIVGIVLVGSVLSEVLGMVISEDYSGWLGYAMGIALVLLIKPTEIFGILLSFKSIALSMLSVIPLAILGLFTIKGYIKHSAGKIILSRIFWIIYVIYMVAEIVIEWNNIVGLAGVIVAVNIGVALLFIFTSFGKMIAGMFRKAKSEAAIEGAEDAAETHATVVEAQKKMEKAYRGDYD